MRAPRRLIMIRSKKETEGSIMILFKDWDSPQIRNERCCGLGIELQHGQFLKAEGYNIAFES